MRAGGKLHRTEAVVLALSLAAPLIGCGEEPPPPVPVARPVKILELGAAGKGSTREFPGEISPAQNANVAFEVSGKLIEFPVRESQHVERGQVLAKLDPRDFESALARESALVRAAQADADRYQKMFDEEVVSQQELEKAQRNYDVTKAKEATAEKALEDTVLRLDDVLSFEVGGEIEQPWVEEAGRLVVRFADGMVVGVGEVVSG